MAQELNPTAGRELYRQMVVIRRFEEQVVAASNRGLVPGSTHPAIGQEAIAVGAISAMNPDDLVLATYRGHHQFIAKGGDLRAGMAEILCRTTGVCRGKGGSMHLSDPDHGLVSSNAIVAAHIPMAGGVALHCKLKGTGQVVAVFFGDGAACEGEFFETLNMAKVWEVPLMFVCENNGLAISVPTTLSQATPDIADRATGFGIPSETVDGNDVLAVRDAMGRAVDRCRAGEGPWFLECKTVRWERHSAFSAGYYASDEERYRWKEADPIPRYRSYLVSEGLASEQDLNAIDEEAAAAAEDARSFAEDSPFPPPEDVFTDVFASAQAPPPG